MKKVLIVFLVLVLVMSTMAIASAAPASPFADVPAGSWAYSAVKQLVQDGILSGYGNGAFQGNNLMTRYEMAQIVANAVTKEDKANAQDKALINKLAAEFAAELDSLGVRVSKLEANQPNIVFKGNAVFRYTDKAFNTPNKPSSMNEQYRFLLDSTAKVDNNTSFSFRYNSAAPDRADFSNNPWTTFGTNAQSSGTISTIDRFNFTTKINDVTATVGRQSFYVDAQNVFMSSLILGFDGIKATAPVGNLNLTTTFGHWINGVTFDGASSTGNLQKYANTLDVRSVSMGSKAGKFDWSLGYYDLHNPSLGVDPFKWTVVNTNYLFNHNIGLNSEYIKNSASENVIPFPGKKSDAYSIKVTIGDQNLDKPAAHNFSINYVNKGANAFANQFSAMGDSTGNSDAANGLNFVNWDLQYGYAFSKTFNTVLQYSRVIPEKAGESVSGADNHFFRVVFNLNF